MPRKLHEEQINCNDSLLGYITTQENNVVAEYSTCTHSFSNSHFFKHPPNHLTSFNQTFFGNVKVMKGYLSSMCEQPTHF